MCQTRSLFWTWVKFMKFQQHILGSLWCKFTLIMLSQHILDHHGVVTILANMTHTFIIITKTSDYQSMHAHTIQKEKLLHIYVV